MTASSSWASGSPPPSMIDIELAWSGADHHSCCEPVCTAVGLVCTAAMPYPGDIISQLSSSSCASYILSALTSPAVSWTLLVGEESHLWLSTHSHSPSARGHFWVSVLTMAIAESSWLRLRAAQSSGEKHKLSRWFDNGWHSKGSLEKKKRGLRDGSIGKVFACQEWD